MEIAYVLLTISKVLLVAVLVVFVWAVSSGQFDDLSGPAYRVLSDDDEL